MSCGCYIHLVSIRYKDEALVEQVTLQEVVFLMSCGCYIHLVSIHYKDEALVGPVVIQEVVFLMSCGCYIHLVSLRPYLLVALPHVQYLRIWLLLYLRMFKMTHFYQCLISSHEVVPPTQSTTTIPPDVDAEATPSYRIDQVMSVVLPPGWDLRIIVEWSMWRFA